MGKNPTAIPEDLMYAMSVLLSMRNSTAQMCDKKCGRDSKWQLSSKASALKSEAQSTLLPVSIADLLLAN